MKKTYISTLVITSLFIFNGCGENTENIENPKIIKETRPLENLPTVDIHYTLNGKERPTCHNALVKGVSNPSPTTTVVCTWICGKYKTDKLVSAMLQFKKNPQTEEGNWYLSKESVKKAKKANCKDL